MLRVLRSESLDLLARETGQPAGRIASWREEFLEAGREGLKSRPRPAEKRELARAQRKVGELQLENDPRTGAVGGEQLPTPLKTVCREAGVSRSAACAQRRWRSVSASARQSRARSGRCRTASCWPSAQARQRVAVRGPRRATSSWRQPDLLTSCGSRVAIDLPLRTEPCRLLLDLRQRPRPGARPSGRLLSRDRGPRCAWA